MPKISVLLPFFNAERYIGTAVSSILNQTYDDFELICIDDGSTDNSVRVVERLAKRDRRIRIIYQAQNQGIAHSLNRGIEASKGQHIARMDADDIAHPQRLEAQRAFLDNRKSIDFVSCAHRIINSKGKYLVNANRLYSQIGTYTFISLFTAPFIHSSMMFRSTFIKQFMYSEEIRHANLEDYELWQRMLFNKAKVHILKEPLMYYRQHSKNVTHTNRKARHRDATEFCQKAIAQRLGLQCNITLTDALRGKREYGLDKVEQFFTEATSKYSHLYHLPERAKPEILDFKQRTLSEIAFKNIKRRKKGEWVKSVKFLLGQSAGRHYLYARIYNYIINSFSR